MDKKIGEIFEINGKKFIVARQNKGSICTGCYFRDNDDCTNSEYNLGSCAEDGRDDALRVIFKEIDNTSMVKFSWKCNKCNGEEFLRKITSGFERETYNKNGELLSSELLEYDTGVLICNECGNAGVDIEDIAKYK